MSESVDRVGAFFFNRRVWVRVTVGTKEEMAKFKDAFAKCYNA